MKRNTRLALGLVLALSAVGILAPWLVPNDPFEIAVARRLSPPSAQFWFGTDHLGRCLFSRMVYGARISLGTGLAVMVLSLTLGGMIGALAALGGRFLDSVIMAVTDVFMALPSLVFALVLAGRLGPGPGNLILVFSLTLWTRYARMVRGQVLSLKQSGHVETARTAGLPWGYLFRTHLFPGILPPLAAMASMGMAMNILMISSLSFLGLGIVEPVPEWGAMLAAGADYFRAAPHMVFFPGLALSLTVLAFNRLGGGISATSPDRIGGKP
ncbi:MAG: ABC transporter permease subunit [Desulfobacterales bacterium]|nr:ABC transporter permease subunit [Desulfobacterales bacterium]